MRGTRQRVEAVKVLSSSNYERPVFVKINVTVQDEAKRKMLALFGEQVSERAMNLENQRMCYATKENKY